MIKMVDLSLFRSCAEMPTVIWQDTVPGRSGRFQVTGCGARGAEV